jgi:hypothetical protein
VSATLWSFENDDKSLGELDAEIRPFSRREDFMNHFDLGID